MRIAIGADHAGYTLKQHLIGVLEQDGHEVIDLGTDSEESVDYPPICAGVAKKVVEGEADRGIVLGGSGQGEAMAANRVKGVRCALFYGPVTPKTAIDAEGDTSSDPYAILQLTREHNLANMLSLAARFLSWEEIEKAVTTWLATPPGNVERHVRRVQKLDQ